MDRRCLFGTVAEGEMILNDAGRMVGQIWADIPRHYRAIAVDTVRVMPNHIHGILFIDPVGRVPVPARMINHRKGGHGEPPLRGYYPCPTWWNGSNP